MKVGDIMTTAVETVTPETPVLDARQQMLNRRIRHLLVCESDAPDARLVGIVTDRDIRLNLPSPATSLSVWELNYLLARLTVGSVMRTSLITIDPRRDTREAAGIMLDHKIGALPVLDAGRLVGIVTETDIMRAYAERREGVAALR
jgi:acetoin utilization protein AcuB